MPSTGAAGLASELEIDFHPYGAAQHCRYRQHIPRGLSERSRDPAHRGRGEGSIVVFCLLFKTTKCLHLKLHRLFFLGVDSPQRLIIFLPAHFFFNHHLFHE